MLLSGLLTLDEASAERSDRALDDAWHAAEAYHFYIRANQLIRAGVDRRVWSATGCCVAREIRRRHARLLAP